ncbi:MAG: transglycosylase domain-containing protein [Clostridia bacterium]
MNRWLKNWPISYDGDNRKEVVALSEIGSVLVQPLEKEQTIASSLTRQEHEWFKRAAFAFVAICLPLLAYMGMVGTGYFLTDRVSLDKLTHSIQSGFIQNQNGLPDRVAIRYQDMPAYITNAIIAIEDHRFHRHIGVDPRGMARAVYVNVIKGEKAQGGSTITMQLARNLFLTQDKTYTRKMKEIAIALYLETVYTKEQLMELYVNQVYFGHGTYGMESAARYYFGKTTRMDGKSVPTISEKEAAMLAGMLKAPEYYSPRDHAKKAEQRQQVVIKRIAELDALKQSSTQRTGTAYTFGKTDQARP